MSTGGATALFRPGGADVNALADNIIALLKKYDFDGIDFDLEHVESTVTEDYLYRLLKALKAKWPAIITSAAPQLNNVGGKLQYVNTGFSTLYNKSVKEGLYDYIFAQEYNTGGNYVNMQGDICTSGSADCYDQKSAGFVVTSFHALKKITPAKTKIVAGQPCKGSAAGAASVYHGGAADPWAALAKAYKSLEGEAQFGGAMTWEVSLDSAQGYKFANAMAPVTSKTN